MPTVYDIRNPINWKEIDKAIFVDTNVVCPIYYDRSALVQTPMANTSANYQQAILNILNNGLHIHISSIVMMEMSRVFMKWDMQIYNKMNPGATSAKNIKVYRRIASEMQSRKQRYSMIYAQLKSAPEIEIHDTLLSCDDVCGYFDTMDSHSMDTNDYLIGQLTQNNNAALLTDDGDYGNTVVGIDLITGNQQLISDLLSLGYNLANPISSPSIP